MSSDEKLMRRIKQGDELAINEFVEKYYPMILAYCRKRVKDYGMAEDMTQETFEHFFRSLAMYKHHGKIQNYLYTIAGNCCKDFYKTNHNELLTDEINMIAVSVSTKEHSDRLSYNPIENIAEQMDMKRAIDELPVIYKEILKLYFVCNLKQTQIATILNIRIHIVKYRIKKGKMLLQKILEDGGFYGGA